MSKTIRAELSKKNPYYLDKYRYYELKYFCLQYPSWKKRLKDFDGLPRANMSDIRGNRISDPTYNCVESRSYFLDRIKMIERVAFSVDNILGDYILIGVTESLSYDKIRVRFNIPCCRDTYYELYRKFFSELNFCKINLGSQKLQSLL